MIRRVEGVDFDLDGLRILPGMVNAHDHLEFALYPRLGKGPYAHAREWARDIYHPEQSPVREHLSVPKAIRLLWGGLRNLVSGVATVAHHNPYDAVFDADFPVRVVKNYGWAHSLDFSTDIAERAASTPSDAPFLIHLGEGTDQRSAEEIFQLRDLGALDARTVIVHGVGINEEGWRIAAEAGASAVWCPQSNLYSLGKTLDLARIPLPVALGTDSPLTSQGDLLDEMRAASEITGWPLERFCPMVTSIARRILRLDEQPGDWIASRGFGDPPELVVIDEKIALVGETLLSQLPPALRASFHPLRLKGRETVFVRWDIEGLIQATRPHLEGLPLTLSGREVMV